MNFIVTVYCNEYRYLAPLDGVPEACIAEVDGELLTIEEISKVVKNVGIDRRVDYEGHPMRWLSKRPLNDEEYRDRKREKYFSMFVDHADGRRLTAAEASALDAAVGIVDVL